jgi:dipeptidyl aminopeptidase/acylaminoacyl peptidase
MEIALEFVRSLGMALMVFWMTVPSVAVAESSALLIDEAAELFSSAEFIRDIKISPDGKHYVVVAENDGGETASIFKYGSDEIVHVVNFDGRWGAGEIKWISNAEIAISPTFTPYLRFQRLSTPDLAVFSIDGKFKKIVFGPNAVGSQQTGLAGRRKIDGGAFLLDPLLDDPERIQIQVVDSKRSGFANLRFRTGKLEGLTYGPNEECSYAYGINGEIKYCSTFKKAKGSFVYPPTREVYELIDDEWILVHVGKPGEDVSVIRGIDSPTKFLATKESDSSITGLFEFDLETKQFTELYTDSRFDIGGVAAIGRDAVAISAHNPLPNYLYLGEASKLSSAHQTIVSAFPGKYVRITSTTEDQELVTFEISDSTTPADYYMFDVRKNEIRFLTHTAPQIANVNLRPMEPFTFTSGDGVLISGFFTQGTGGADSGSVVIVHGGPHGPFDRYQYHREVQFFSQIGLNVIQVNFRGSGGFGREFEELGYLEWSGKMIDDIVEGASFIGTQKGLAKKMCVYGGSYGGFASLSAAFRYPDFFQCAAGHVGVYDLPKMYSTGDIPEDDFGKNYLRAVISDDRDKLERDSPSYQASKIQIPVLLTHGKEDYRADVVHSRIMERRLTSLGKEVEATYVSKEMHGFADTSNERERLIQLGNFVQSSL